MYIGKHRSKDKKKLNILSVIRIIFFIGVIVSIVFIIKWFIDNNKNEVIIEKVEEAIIIDKAEENNEVEYKVDFEKLKEINQDVVAWIKVNGTSIEYPIVQSTNNKYYLDRNLNKEYNSAGWIFADYKNKFDGTDKNIVIYGHNRRDDSMFGSLEKILEDAWYNNNENYIIDFVTINEEQKYKVFSVYKIKNEDYYIDTEFKNNEFEKFINTLKDRSIKNFDIEVSKDDTILTLSTCADNNKYRIVLHAKKK